MIKNKLIWSFVCVVLISCGNSTYEPQEYISTNLTDEKISFIISKQRIDLKKRIKFKNWEINISIILIVLKILKVNLKKLSQNLEK